MAINIDIPDVLGRKRRQNRQYEAAQIAQDLLTRGAEPELANQVATHYAKTGEFQIPSVQTKALPATEDIPERSTRIPVDLGRKKAVYGMDRSSGLFTDMGGKPVTEVPDNVDPSVVQYDSTSQTGHGWKIDRATGKREDTGPNGRAFDTYQYWNSKTGTGLSGRGAGGASETPQQKSARSLLNKYFTSVQGGYVPDEMYAMIPGAAQALGMSSEEIPTPENPTPQGFLSKLFNFEPPAPAEPKKTTIPKFAGKSAAVKEPKVENGPTLEQKAEEWLKTHNAKVTPANIEAVIKEGKVKE